MTWSLSCLFCLVTSLAVPAIAQDRMPNIPPDKLTEAQKKAANERHAAQLVVRAEACRDPKMDQAKCAPAYFDVHGPMVPLLRSPEVMVAANAMDNYLEFRSVLPPEIREFVILITAHEETFSSRVTSRTSYIWDEVRWDAKFADVFVDSPDGIITIDVERLDRFDRLTEGATRVPAPAEVG